MFDPISKHLKFVKNAPPRVVVSALFSMFGNVVKHETPCLIYKNKVCSPKNVFQ